MLVILDGWGLAPAGSGNAISLARTPNFEYYWSNFLHTKLSASGEAVGLPVGQMGNSEVGHLNIGSGRAVLQDLPRITKSIKDGDFFHNKSLLGAFASAKAAGSSLHLLGLVSPGGVHSHQEHLYALLEMAKQEKVHNVFVHVFTDGRDVKPKSALKYVQNLEKTMKDIGVGTIATVSGRYYSMDRDNRWNRIQSAYDAIVSCQGELADSAEEAIERSYKVGITDEFIRPTIIDKEGTIKNGDSVIFFNFRSDRPRELCHALLDTKFKSFIPHQQLKNLYFVTMADYDPSIPVSAVAFPSVDVSNTLSETISQYGLEQFHIAETEKYAHVTFYFNGGKEKPVVGEERLLVPSPQVSTYDLRPKMSIGKVEEELLQRIGSYDFIVVNFANPDMVGHTGKLKPAIEACEYVDEALGRVVRAAQKEDYTILVTADHGNIEKMLNSDGTPNTAHTTDKVPFILITQDDCIIKKVVEPKLSNIAPTILSIMGLPKPKEMSASLLVE